MDTRLLETVLSYSSREKILVTLKDVAKTPFYEFAKKAVELLKVDPEFNQKEALLAVLKAKVVNIALVELLAPHVRVGADESELFCNRTDQEKGRPEGHFSSTRNQSFLLVWEDSERDCNH